MPIRRTRLLFTSYTADWTGPTSSLLLLLKELRARYEVAVLLAGNGLFHDALQDEGIRVHALPSLDRSSIPAVVRLLRRQGFDMLYANTTHGSSRNAIIAARLAGVPSICHVRAIHWAKSWRQLWYLRLCSAVIAVSRATAESVRRFVRAGKLFVVHNGIDLHAFERRRSAGVGLRAALQLPADTPLVLNVSHICRRKGQEHLLGVAERVSRSVPEAHLCLVGRLDRDPDYVGRLRRELSQRSLDGRVHLLGFRTDVPEILAEAAVYVHSAIADPHPRAVIEAMAAELPVVAFAVDGVAETVEDGVTGRLVDRGDSEALASAVADLLRCPEVGRRMGYLGRARARERFTARATAERVGDILETVVAVRECR